MMSNGVLDRVEASLQDFKPRSQREFVALQIARRFHDIRRLARYLNIARDHPKRLMLEAARRATLRHELNRSSLGDLFFEVIAEFDKEDRR
jgi:G3E family GTPase